jgi:hypothetical protein
MLTLFVVAQSIALFVAVPLLALYFKERIKNLARESTERALADYKHQYDQSLAEINANHQRQLEEFNLFTRKRHLVYGSLYRRVRIAADAFGSMVGLVLGTDFGKYVVDDALEYFDRHEVPASARKPIIRAYEDGDAKKAAKLLDDLDRRLRRLRAMKAFAAAKNVEAACELYLSDDVRAQMNVVRTSIASVSVIIDRENEREFDDLEKRDAMMNAVTGLFDVMRKELKR